MCAGLTAQQAADGNPWTDLIVTSGGQNLRALSPQNGIVLNSSLLSGYYDDYVSQVWQMYESATLTVDTQAGPVSSGSPALLGCRWGRCTEGYGCPLVRDVTARSASFYRVLRLTAPSGW